MQTDWARFDHAVGELTAEYASADREDVVGELTALAAATVGRPVPRSVSSAAAAVPVTPAVLWDLEGLSAHAHRLDRMFRGHGIVLNLAMKACSTPAVLDMLANVGFGCDVASRYEFKGARRHPFREISACGPSFGPNDAASLAELGAFLDYSSLTQARQVAGTPGVTAAGVRLRVPMPARLETSTIRGLGSRFGVVLNAEAVEVLSSEPLLRRLRVHTGESTGETLAFRARYGVAAASLFGGIETINLGGGFLRLSRQPDALRTALDGFTEAVKGCAERYRFTAEPGAALVVDHAYLVTEVIAVEDHPTRGHLITVDASGWNVAPWSKWASTSFYTVRDTGDPRPTTVVGPSLYELDAFSHSAGSAQHTFPLAPCAPGDRLIGTSFGAYTMTNGRSFNGFPLPAAYDISEGGLKILHSALSFSETSSL